ASRLDAELVREEAEPVDLKRLVENIVDAARNVSSKKKKVDLVIEIDGKTKNYIVQGHDLRLGQVRTNLIENARSFVPEGTARSTAQRQHQEKEGRSGQRDRRQDQELHRSGSRPAARAGAHQPDRECAVLRAGRYGPHQDHPDAERQAHHPDRRGQWSRHPSRQHRADFRTLLYGSSGRGGLWSEFRAWPLDQPPDHRGSWRYAFGG